MFSDLVNFIERQLKILSDTLFGDLQSGQLASSFRVKPKSKLTSKGLASVSAVNTVNIAQHIKSSLNPADEASRGAK